MKLTTTLRLSILCGLIHTSASGQIEITNLGLDATPLEVHSDESIVAVIARERGNGDLNGDGDTTDFLLHVYDSATGETTNLNTPAWSLYPNMKGVFVENRRVAFGDEDGLLRIYDATTKETFHTGLDVWNDHNWWFDFRASGDLIVAIERLTHHTYLINASTQSVINTGILGGYDGGSGVPEYIVDGRYACLKGYDAQFNLTYYLYDAQDGSITTIGEGFRSVFSMEDGIVALVRSNTLFVYDHRDGSLTDLGIPLGGYYDYWASSALIKDGLVMTRQHVYDTDTKEAPISLSDPVYGGRMVSDGSRLVYRGLSNRLTVYDRETQTVSVLDERGEPVGLHGNWLSYHRMEWGVDRNGDGDIWDRWVVFHDLTTGQDIAVFEGSCEVQNAHLAVFSLPEAKNGDLNGDGDLEDAIIHAFDFETGAAANLGLHGWVGDFRGNLLSVVASEANQGSDLNGDGDTSDSIAHAITILSVQPNVVELIEELTDILNELDLSQGLVSNLQNQLEGVLAALDPDQPGEGDTAEQRLQAFINATEAQRGKKLSEEEADQLITTAQAAQAIYSNQ